MDQDAIPISKSPRHFPGKPPALCTIYRWMQKGVRGVKLQTFSVGMRRYVSQDAINDFVTRTTAAGPYSAETIQGKTSKQRQRSIEAAERELDQAGI